MPNLFGLRIRAEILVGYTDRASSTQTFRIKGLLTLLHAAVQPATPDVPTAHGGKLTA